MDKHRQADERRHDLRQDFRPRAHSLERRDIHASDIGARALPTRNPPHGHEIAPAGRTHNRDRTGHLFARKHRWITEGDNHLDGEIDEFLRQHAQASWRALGVARFQSDILAMTVTQLPQRLGRGVDR
jgi:hypothetical protein